jgi:chemotaxis protein CheY-P-specific phosphatase CheC
VKESFQIVSGSDAKITEIAKTSLQAIASNIQSLVDKEVTLTPSPPTIINNEHLQQLINENVTHLHGDLEKDYEGRISILFSWPASITLSSLLRMIPEEVVAQARKAGTWTEEDDEAFGEVGNILFSALDETLRATAKGKVNIRLGGFAKLDFMSDEPDILGDDTYLLYDFTCQIGDYPEDKGFLLLPLDAAEKFNGAAIGFHSPGGEDDGDDEDEDFEDAPIRGHLSFYGNQADVLKTLKTSCRRVGLVFDKRPKAEVPNPAAHREHVIILEIGRGQEKRFDWCRRLKSSDVDLKVIILLLQPTKMGVVLAYKAQADAILGWPAREKEISSKLASFLESKIA